jgi:hypothetical protein
MGIRAETHQIGRGAASRVEPGAVGREGKQLPGRAGPGRHRIGRGVAAAVEQGTAGSGRGAASGVKQEAWQEKRRC